MTGPVIRLIPLAARAMGPGFILPGVAFPTSKRSSLMSVYYLISPRLARLCATYMMLS
jgi:hypothetical protein